MYKFLTFRWNSLVRRNSVSFPLRWGISNVRRTKRSQWAAVSCSICSWVAAPKRTTDCRSYTLRFYNTPDPRNRSSRLQRRNKQLPVSYTPRLQPRLLHVNAMVNLYRCRSYRYSSTPTERRNLYRTSRPHTDTPTRYPCSPCTVRDSSTNSDILPAYNAYRSIR